MQLPEQAGAPAAGPPWPRPAPCQVPSGAQPPPACRVAGAGGRTPAVNPPPCFLRSCTLLTPTTGLRGARTVTGWRHRVQAALCWSRDRVAAREMDGRPPGGLCRPRHPAPVRQGRPAHPGGPWAASWAAAAGIALAGRWCGCTAGMWAADLACTTDASTARFDLGKGHAWGSRRTQTPEQEREN